jgi:protein-tyrosine phosphatase
MKIRVLFVCLGNICRSPTAHGVFIRKVAEAGLADVIDVDSAGTGDWHIGRSPDLRSQAAALKRGYDLSALRARQVSAADFSEFDYILAMDKINLSDLQRMRQGPDNCHLALFLDYAAKLTLTEVPDPFYDADDGFEQVLELVEAGSLGLLADIKVRLSGQR